MKKSIILSLCFVLFSFIALAGKFVLIPISETNNLETLFSNNDLIIHYYCDEYVLATTDNLNFKDVAVLDENAFADVDNYAIVYCYDSEKEDYLSKIAGSVETLYSGNHFFIMKLVGDGFQPAKNDGMVMISNSEAKLANSKFDFPTITEIDPFIQLLIEKTNTDTLMSYVQKLQDFGTRVYFQPQSYDVVNWLKSKYDELGLETELQTFSAAGNGWGTPATSSENVIAIQKGTIYPDEYIVCGSHHDSFVPYQYTNCPGADDNATGTAGILETARILSQYELGRSIIYCNFSAEEVGLFGSGAYAARCAQQGMNIVGYFNIDMSGYLQAGSTMHIDLIHPTSALPLANYYINVAGIYFPGIQVTSYSNLPGGDSDHTSFNNNGYMGIFPFEDRINDSPYIHTVNDLIGPSVNTPEQVKLFAQMNIASIATLAILNESQPVLSLSKTSSSVEGNGGEDIDDYITVYNLGDAPLTFEIKDIIFDCDFTECLTIEPLEGTLPPLDSLTITLSYFLPQLIKTVDMEFFGSFNFICNDPTQEKTEISLYALAHIEGSINETELSAFNIYPNPAKNELQITSYELRVTSVEIFDVYGRKLTPHTLYFTPHTLVDISDLAAGIYFVRINDRFTGKFVKK